MRLIADIEPPRAGASRLAGAGLPSSVLVLGADHVGEAVTTRLISACVEAGWSAGRGQPDQAAQAGLVLDLRDGGVVPRGPEVWSPRVGPSGLGGRFALSAAWHRPPYWLQVAITCRGVGSARETIASAWIGCTGGYEALRERVTATLALLLLRALSGAPRPVPDDSFDGVGQRRDGLPAWLGGWLRWQAARWRSRFFVEWWTVGICDHPIEAVLRQGRLGHVTWLRPEPGAAYWADPFAWPGTDRILCEEYPIEGGVGVIAALRPTAGGGWERAGVLLGDRRHRSYPFTFAEDGETWLLPECLDEGAVVLYRLDAHGRTEAIATVAERPLGDATLFRYQERYWVAGTDLAIGAHDNLCLFHADRLAGPWRPHRHNPVKIDIRSSRSAGTPFHHDGRLFRPAQDCAGAYGAAVVINEVTTLTPENFTERPVVRLAPDPEGPLPDGLHTISAAGERTLVDGKRMVASPGAALRKLKRRLSGVARDE